jgi:hypothetical protein
VETLNLKVFVNSIKPRDEELVSHWEALATTLNILIHVELIDIGANPDIASEFDIVFTPTIIARMPSGKLTRYVGYNTDIELIIRSCGWYNYSQTMAHSVQELLKRNAAILADSQRMKEETIRMRSTIQIMKNKIDKTD